MTQLIECIPNFSEARRPEIIDQIVAAITSVEGARLLDRSSDLDHNRTVLTFAGEPFAVEEAAFRAIKTAAELIDLDAHTGAHPRIGATDVVPFVPLSNASMQDCVEIAKRVGQRVGDELSLPVYLYEAAAARPERANLENIRKGQYETLKTEIESNPERNPDYGPSKLPKAGATVIGARAPLIAFNIYLTTDDVSIAKKIAKAVRQSSGGLRYVKGLGLLVEGRAQVSMNLTNFHETPIARVVEFVRREAERYGVGHSSQRTDRIDPARGFGGCGGLVHPTGIFLARTDSRNQALLFIRRLGSFYAQACFFCRRISRPYSNSRRWSRRRIRRSNGRSAGRDGCRTHTRQKEICKRRSQYAGDTRRWLKVCAKNYVKPPMMMPLHLKF